MVETKDDNKSVDPLVLNLLSTTGRGLKPWTRAVYKLAYDSIYDGYL